MFKILAIVALVSSGQVADAPEAEMMTQEQDCSEMYACMCFFKYERTSGLNKICFYDCCGSERAITVSSVTLCPLSI